ARHDGDIGAVLFQAAQDGFGSSHGLRWQPGEASDLHAVTATGGAGHDLVIEPQSALRFFLRGEKLKGSFALVRTSSDKQWLLLKHKDRFADANDDVLARNRSVVSGATLDELVPGRVWNSGDPPKGKERNAARLESVRLAPHGPTEKMPARLLPMLAQLGETPRSEPQWLYEPKLDGYRVIAFVQGDTVRLQSRRGIDLTAAFPEIVADLAAQAVEGMILDGEIVVLAADGRPSFNALQNRVQMKSAREIAEAQRESPAVLVCFDLLHFAGLNLRGSPYVDRRRYLEQCLLPDAHLQLIHVFEDARKLYAAALDSGFEGIVAKRKDSIYQAGKRTNAWVKYKSTSTAEFVIGGFTRGKGARESLGALLLGYWEGKELRYAGHVGSGFTEALVTQLLKRVKDSSRRTAPFAAHPPLHRPTTWLEPKLVAEVTFADWTPEGHLRAPVFVRLRDDIEARSIRGRPQQGRVDHGSEGQTDEPPGKRRATARRKSAGTSPRPASRTPANEIELVVQQLEGKAKQMDLAVGGAKIRLTNLDREYWPAQKEAKQPAITKREYLRYLAQVSPYMLPHLIDRPLTMIRMPAGIDGERFFQKHWEQSRPDFVETITVFSGHKGENHEYLLGNNLPTLLWLGQVGTLEFHIWHSRAKVEADAASKQTDYASSLESLEASVLNYPDYLVFDIDPYIYSGKEAQGAEPELNARGFAVGRRVAFWINELLRQMSLSAVVKTSGKTGLHVFVPIERTVTFDQARSLCEMVGRHVMREHPREVTMDWAVIKRTGKIFIDYNMNVRGKTLNVAYSPRGVPGAPVSMPLTWDELEAADPTHFTLRSVIARLEKTGDRWHDVLSVKQSLAKAFKGQG
ncbi:MAG: DNA ligase D, partial [Gammaproteobacteria bacterium]|nr:DNA ligase D [Gammaproteobacteria bacterium]